MSSFLKFLKSKLHPYNIKKIYQFDNFEIYIHSYWVWDKITAWKESKYKAFSGPNAGKHGPKKTPHLDSFHAVNMLKKLPFLGQKEAKRLLWCSLNPTFTIERLK